ncbi:UNKNOWN [Stylonychia lemnae]|uniref:Uncharacterized protein n=1 Tax=Stylonychia lemnae TaxID=5949 RepID=A0A077ZYA0_STYLE|nr:UNKNOWN [Stylonychia lemnae]|eukprot:CDW74876.1 UNKNOWN [Stylonychia lemnae]
MILQIDKTNSNIDKIQSKCKNKQQINQEIICFVQLLVHNLKQMIGGWKQFANIVIKQMQLSGYQDQEILDLLGNHQDLVNECSSTLKHLRQNILTQSQVFTLSLIYQMHNQVNELNLKEGQNDQSINMSQDLDQNQLTCLKGMKIAKNSSQQSQIPQDQWKAKSNSRNEMEQTRDIGSDKIIGQNNEVQVIQWQKNDQKTLQQNKIPLPTIANDLNVQILSSKISIQELPNSVQFSIDKSQNSVNKVGLQNDSDGKIAEQSFNNISIKQEALLVHESDIQEEVKLNIDSSQEIYNSQVINANQNLNKNFGDLSEQNPQVNQIQALANTMDNKDQLILKKDPAFKILRPKKRRQNDKQVIIQSFQEIKEINLNPQKKTTLLYYNMLDEKLLLGLSDAYTQVYSIKNDEEWELTSIITPISVFNYQESIYFGLNSKQVVILDRLEYEQKKLIDTTEIVIKIILYTHYDYQNNTSKEYLVFLEEKGYIEFYSLQNYSVIFTYQHNCKMDIKDGFQVHNSNQLCLGFSELVQNEYKNGQLSFIQIIRPQNNNQQSNKLEILPKKIEQEIQIKELENIKYFNKKVVFCVQQISTNCFIALSIHKNIFFFNRKYPKKVQQIHNPSGSINYNSLVKIDGFRESRPYLIFRDSKSLGLINCKSLEVFTLAQGIDYARCGNLFCLEQSSNDKEGKLYLYTMIFERISGKRSLRVYSLNIENNM